jgi:molybdopterin-guanine dinucleotide biosynthesis protein B
MAQSEHQGAVPRRPKAIGFFGDSGSGKTTLIEGLIGHFHRAGLRVAAVKHAHHGFDVDRPGKDSYRFRGAGAAQVLVASERRWVLMSEGDGPGAAPADSSLARQLARFDPCDLVLVEGFRGQAGIPFIQVRRRAGPAAAPRTAPASERDRAVAGVVAVASDEPLPEPGREGIPLLDLNDIAGIAAFIARELKLDMQSC